MSNVSYKVLPRIVVGTIPSTVMLIFPESIDRSGLVGIYEKVGQHSMASIPYVEGNTRPPRTVEEWRACLDLIEEERTLPPEAEQLEARIVTRLR